MANLEVLALDTAVPQIRAPGVGDGYSVPRDMTLASGTVLSAPTVDATNVEVTNVKAKDGTAAATIADSTGVVSITANPVLSGGTANGVLYLNGSKVATSGSGLYTDGTRFGIGTVSFPAGQRLRVAGGDVGFEGQFFYLLNADASIQLGAAQNSQIINSDSGNLLTISRTGASSQIAFSTAGSERLRLDASGNLGLGVSPSAWVSTGKAFQLKIHAFSSQHSGDLSIMTNAYESSAGTFTYIETNPAIRYQQDVNNTAHKWYTAASGTAGNNISFGDAKMTLDASGNLLVNTTTSGQGKLMVKQAASSVAGGIALQATSTDSYLGIWNDGSVFNIDAYYNSTGSYQPIAFRTSNTERARITAAGDLLVGTTTSSAKLTVSGDFSLSNSLGVAKTLTGSSASVANDGTLTLTGFNQSGLFSIVDNADRIALFLCSATGSPFTTEVSDPSTVYSNTQGTASSTNVYFSGGVVTIENKTGSSRTYRVHYLTN